MSLPVAWIDRIFTKLTLVYGRDFLGRWEGLDLNAVKSDWAHELAGFEKFPEGIAHALTHLDLVKPPTVFQFRDLARKAPVVLSTIRAERMAPDRSAHLNICASRTRLNPASTTALKEQA